MMTQHILMSCAAALAAFTPAALGIDTPAQPAPSQMPLMVQHWVADNSAAILVEPLAEGDFNAHPFIRRHDDGEAHLLFGRVAHSTTPECKIGSLVLLELPGESEHKPGMWRLVQFHHTQKLTADGSAYYIMGLDFTVFRAEVLLRARDELQGVWKEMAEMVADGDPGCR